MSKFILSKRTSPCGPLYFAGMIYNLNPRGIASPRSILWTGFPERACAYETPHDAGEKAREFKIDRKVIVEPAFLPKIEGSFAPAQ